MNNPLQGTVKIGGKPVKKVYVLAGVTITAAILAYAYYRRANAPATDAPATDATATADGYTPTDTTGYSGGGGSGSDGGGGSSSPWPYGYDVNGNQLPAPTGSGTGTGGVTGSNQEWTTAAIAALESGGMTGEKASEAITAVLGGLGVTSDQEATFLRAVGVLGDPPQGYPKPIRHISTPADPHPAPDPQPTPDPQPAPDPTPGPDPTPAPAPTPKPAPKPAPKPTPKPATAGIKVPNKPGGVKVTHKTKTTVKVDWNPVHGADGYVMYKNGNRVTTSVYSVYTFSGLKANTSYTFGVATLDGKLISQPTTINARTTK